MSKNCSQSFIEFTQSVSQFIYLFSLKFDPGRDGRLAVRGVAAYKQRKTSCVTIVQPDNGVLVCSRGAQLVVATVLPDDTVLADVTGLCGAEVASATNIVPLLETQFDRQVHFSPSRDDWTSPRTAIRWTSTSMETSGTAACGSLGSTCTLDVQLLHSLDIAASHG